MLFNHRCSQTIYWYQRQFFFFFLKMCVLLEWLWGSTWARHRCAPTYTKALTMTVSPKKPTSPWEIHCCPPPTAPSAPKTSGWRPSQPWCTSLTTTSSTVCLLMTCSESVVLIPKKKKGKKSLLSWASLCFFREMEKKTKKQNKTKKKRCWNMSSHLSHIRPDVRINT